MKWYTTNRGPAISGGKIFHRLLPGRWAHHADGHNYVIRPRHTMTHMIYPPPGQEFSKFPKLSFLFYSFKNVKLLFSKSPEPSRSGISASIVLSNTVGLICLLTVGPFHYF